MHTPPILLLLHKNKITWLLPQVQRGRIGKVPQYTATQLHCDDVCLQRNDVPKTFFLTPLWLLQTKA